MAEPQVINTLDAKRREIESHIGSLEQDLEQARRDLSAILSAIKVFSGDGVKVTAYMNLSRLFPRHELPKLAMTALKASPDGLSTTAIAGAVIAAKGLDGGDRHLRAAVVEYLGSGEYLDTRHLHAAELNAGCKPCLRSNLPSAT